MDLFPKFSKWSLAFIFAFFVLCLLEGSFSVEAGISYGFLGAVGRWISGKKHDPNKTRALQLKLANKAAKDIDKAEKAAPITQGEMTSATSVSGGVGDAAAANLAQGGGGLGAGFDPNAQKQVAEGSANVTSAATAQNLAALQGAKGDWLRRKYGIITTSGESAWKEGEADANRGAGVVSAGLNFVGSIFA